MKHFPNVRQEQSICDDRERCFSRGAFDQVRPYVAHMNRARTSLGKQAFGPTRKTRIKKPQPGHNTCGVAARPQQVAYDYEKRLLTLDIHDGHFVDLAPIKRSRGLQVWSERWLPRPSTWNRPSYWQMCAQDKPFSPFCNCLVA